MDLDDL